MQILVDKLVLGESCQVPMLRSVTQGRWDMLESIAISSRSSMSVWFSQSDNLGWSLSCSVGTCILLALSRLIFNFHPKPV